MDTPPMTQEITRRLKPSALLSVAVGDAIAELAILPGGHPFLRDPSSPSLFPEAAKRRKVEEDDDEEDEEEEEETDETEEDQEEEEDEVGDDGEPGDAEEEEEFEDDEDLDEE